MKLLTYALVCSALKSVAPGRRGTDNYVLMKAQLWLVCDMQDELTSLHGAGLLLNTASPRRNGFEDRIQQLVVLGQQRYPHVPLRSLLALEALHVVCSNTAT